MPCESAHRKTRKALYAPADVVFLSVAERGRRGGGTSRVLGRIRARTTRQKETEMQTIGTIRRLVVAGAFLAFGGLGATAHAAGVCNGALNLGVTQANFLAVGDTATITINIGSGAI